MFYKLNSLVKYSKAVMKKAESHLKLVLINRNCLARAFPTLFEVEKSKITESIVKFYTSTNKWLKE